MLIYEALCVSYNFRSWPNSPLKPWESSLWQWHLATHTIIVLRVPIFRLALCSKQRSRTPSWESNAGLFYRISSYTYLAIVTIVYTHVYSQSKFLHLLIPPHFSIPLKSCNFGALQLEHGIPVLGQWSILASHVVCMKAWRGIRGLVLSGKFTVYSLCIYIYIIHVHTYIYYRCVYLYIEIYDL